MVVERNFAELFRWSGALAHEFKTCGWCCSSYQDVAGVNEVEEHEAKRKMFECVKRKINREKQFNSEMSGRWKDESKLL